MKLAQLILLFGLTLLIILSCSKESTITVIDNIPIVEPVDTTIVESEVVYASAKFSPVEASIFTDKNNDGEVNSYSMLILYPQLDVETGLFLFQWKPTDIENEISEKIYQGSTATAISNEFINELNSWIDNGSIPEEKPELAIDDIISYISTEVNIKVTDVKNFSAYIEIYGQLTTLSGEANNIEGHFNAGLY